jgi:uncharacterized protein YqfA (UPF0365 family)
MKTIEEMDKEDEQTIEKLRKSGQEDRETLFNAIKNNVLVFVVLVAIIVIFCSDIAIAWACIAAAVVLALNLISLLGLYLYHRISIRCLKQLMKQVRAVEMIHQLFVEAKKKTGEKS